MLHTFTYYLFNGGNNQSTWQARPGNLLCKLSPYTAIVRFPCYTAPQNGYFLQRTWAKQSRLSVCA